MDELRDDMTWSTRADPRRPPSGARMRIGTCLVESELDRLTGPGGAVQLEPKTMAVLVHLVRRAGQVVSTGELVEVVWLGRPMGDNPVYRCIAQLRRALGDDARAPRYIATVPTKGYRLIAPVELLPDAPLPDAGASTPDTTRPCPETGSPRRRIALRWGALAGGIAVLAVIAGLALVRRPPPRQAVAFPPRLVLLPMQAAGGQGADRLLAQSLGGLLGERLARNPRLRLIADGGKRGGDVADDVRDARQLHAGYALSGVLAPAGDHLRASLRLSEAVTGRVLWSSVDERPLENPDAWRAEAAARVSQALGVTAPPLPPEAPTRLDAYESYVQGREQLARDSAASAAAAVELFRRASVLAPRFARAYLGLGEALLRQAEADPGPALAKRDEAMQAIEHALELDPGLGEAWVARARLTPEATRAEQLYRKGLALAPSDGPGYVNYARFLFGRSRPGEAIDTLEQARQLDPLDPDLCLTQAFFVMVARSDVREHDRLVGQALAIDPQSPEALYQLAYSQWEYSGRFAQAAQSVERAIAADPRALRPRLLARDIYLDLGDPARASAVLGPDAPKAARVAIAQYQGDRAAAASLLRDLPASQWPDVGPQASAAQALRDAGIASGNLGPALARMRNIDAARRNGLPMWFRGYAVVRAHTLLLAGQVDEGRRLARATLAMLDAHGIGRRPHWFSRERAGALAVLGKNDDALGELSYSVRNGQLSRWWYLARYDPLFAALRNDPRFRALDQNAQRRIGRERAQYLAARPGVDD